jgi:hypothetical protein
LKRMEGLARSPIFAMLSESLSGIATIRSNNALDYFQQKFRVVHDVSTFTRYECVCRCTTDRCHYNLYILY